MTPGSASCGEMEIQGNVVTFPKPLLAQSGLQITCFRDFSREMTRHVDSKSEWGDRGWCNSRSSKTKAAGHDRSSPMILIG